MYYFGDRRVIRMLEGRRGTPAALFSVAPSVGGAGDIPVQVSLVGQGFGPVAVVTVSGTLIAVTNVVVVSPNLITATFTIDAAAAQTARTVTVTTLGVITGAVTFTVTASTNLVGTGLELWLDATRSQDLTIATGVSEWKDRNGSGRKYIQATAGRQPVVDPATMNGLNTVKSDGVDDALALAASPIELSQGSTVFIAADVLFPNDLIGRPLFNTVPSIATGVQHEPSNDPNVPSRSKLETFASTNAGLKRATPAGVTAMGPRIITTRVAPAEPSVKMYKNGVLDGGPTAGFANLPTSIGDTLYLFTDNLISFGNYRVGEKVLFSRALSDADRQAWEAYLIRKWINVPTIGRGPILLNSSVIGGATITVVGVNVDGAGNWISNYNGFNTPFKSVLRISFSTPIIQFAVTTALNSSMGVLWGGGPPNPASQQPDVPSPILVATPATDFVATRHTITYAPGFSYVYIADNQSFFQASDMRFWLVGEPL